MGSRGGDWWSDSESLLKGRSWDGLSASRWGREGPGDMEDLGLTVNGGALLLSWGRGL